LAADRPEAEPGHATSFSSRDYLSTALETRGEEYTPFSWARWGRSGVGLL